MLPIQNTLRYYRYFHHANTRRNQTKGWLKIFFDDLFKAQEDFPGGEMKIDHVSRMQIAPRFMSSFRATFSKQVA